jgi:polysaccharide export outer membrane protein
MRRLTACFLVLLLVASRPATGDDYEIGQGDVLQVTVLGQAEMTGNFSVDSEGMMAFPVLGKVKASAMSTKELERKLTTLLADGYLKRPQVSVAMQEFKSQRVFVTGEVLKPGPYALKVDRSLLALMSDIGGFTPNAGHEIVVIRPPVGGGTPLLPTGGESPETPDAPDAPPDPESPPDPEAPSAPPPAAGMTFAVPGAEVFRVSIIELQSGNPERNILLQAGDTVYVPRAAQVYISGSVARPGPIRFQEGMTLLQALTVAGGATERGSQGRAKVLRTVEGKKQQVKIKLTDLVQPEDTIIVPERFF